MKRTRMTWTCWVGASCAVIAFSFGCSDESGARRIDPGLDPVRPEGPGTPPATVDGGSPTTPTAPTSSPDGGPNPEAFWAEDPPPLECREDGTMAPPPEPPGGTPECPDDKNREGCLCSDLGATAPCWPGLRANRGLGICQDGTTTCEAVDEFNGRWGPCEGYVLPDNGATSGPGACRCFSEGTWDIDNISPCIQSYTFGRDTTYYGVSTYIDESGRASCPDPRPNSRPPPNPQPGEPWSTSRLTVDCAGQFKLCLTVKAGDHEAPDANDCVLAESCVEAWVDEPGTEQELPPLPSWVSTDTACSQQFRLSGGYGEMSVKGLSAACDVVDDGNDEAYVFQRFRYCAFACNKNPNAPGCADCQMEGSGRF